MWNKKNRMNIAEEMFNTIYFHCNNETSLCNCSYQIDEVVQSTQLYGQKTNSFYSVESTLVENREKKIAKFK